MRSARPGSASAAVGTFSFFDHDPSMASSLTRIVPGGHPAVNRAPAFLRMRRSACFRWTICGNICATSGAALSVPRLVFVLLLAGVVLQIASYYPRVPEVMASHFGADGRPNGWSTRTTFFGLYAGGAAIAALISLGAPWLLRVAPRWVNLPHKSYWLAPERRSRTESFFAAGFAWFGCAMLALLLAVMELALRANLGASRRLDPAMVWLVLAGFALFLAVWLTVFLSRFYRPA